MTTPKPNPVKIQSDVGEVVVDATITESHNQSATTTDFPIENSFDGTDSVQQKAKQYVMQGVFANGRMAEGQQGYQGEPGQAGPAQVAFDQLSQWMAKGKLLTIVTEFKRHASMVLTELTAPRSVEIGEAIRFSATFKEIRIVASQLVKLIKPTPVDPKRPTGPTENKSKVVPEVVNDPETKRRIKESAAVWIGKKAGALGVPK